jgi:hypothetical protein
MRTATARNVAPRRKIKGNRVTNNGSYVGPKGHCCVRGTEAAPGYGAPAGEHEDSTTGESCEGVSLSTNKPDGS